MKTITEDELGQVVTRIIKEVERQYKRNNNNHGLTMEEAAIKVAERLGNNWELVKSE